MRIYQVMWLTSPRREPLAPVQWCKTGQHTTMRAAQQAIARDMARAAKWYGPDSFQASAARYKIIPFPAV